MTDLPDVDQRRRDWQSRHATYLSDPNHSRCPCCCYRTRGTPGDYCICDVCRWEDDAQDESDADEVWGGPNGDASLSQARENFIRFGASLPRRGPLDRPPKPDEL